MKDALGHGSDSRGMASAATAGNHQRGVLRVGRIKVQQLNTKLMGQPWQTVGRYKGLAVAERQAQHARVDNKNTLYRIPGQSGPSLARVKNLGKTAP
jgi:hypothetical protein